MSETIYKLQPNRTMHLRGFDDRGAAGAMHSATANSFSVEGVFRDAADFCVLMLWDADDYFGHPRFKYLPDFDFAGIVLTFDFRYTNLRVPDSPLFPSIPWDALSVVRADGTSTEILLDANYIPGAAAGWQRVEIDFTALGIDSIRQAWITLAPDPTQGVEYTGEEWLAEFDNWTVSDPSGRRPLKVAGAGSVRVNSRSAWTTYSGASWAEEASNQPGGTGFFDRGFARRAAASGDKVTIFYASNHAHDLYLGTSLYTDRGIVSVSIDGGSPANFDAYVSALAPVVTRRLLAAGLAAGEHTVVITLTGTKNAASSNYYFYFDYLEAAVPDDVPDALTPNTAVTAAVDYGTDHAYKLPPARLMWMIEQLGFAGRMNVYISVFWWNQRENTTRVVPQATVTIPGAAVVAGNNVFIDVSGLPFGHFVGGGDTPSTVAAAIAAKVNDASTGAVGVWASSSGDVITITNRSATYSFVLTAWYETPAGGTVTPIAPSGSLSGGDPGQWDIDPSITPVLNIAAVRWLEDLLAEAQARSLEVVLAFSLELLNPPSAWASRYNDGSAVLTATGFGSNFTTHCALGQPDFLDYQKAAYLEAADLMDAAGLDVRLQCGEFVWWFFAGGSPASMAFYDAATVADANAALGRALYVFSGPNEDIAGHTDDTDFLAARLHDHVEAIRDHVQATYADAEIELLLPLDVNYPSPVGKAQIGGQVNNAVNIPAAFLDESTAPFELLKIEGLDFGAYTRSYDLALEAMRWAFVTGTWDPANVSYLMPWFNGGCPWPREYLGAVRESIERVVLYAFDHVCLMSWPMPLPMEKSRTVVS